MAHKTALKELQIRLKPYLEFWEEWTMDESCFLKEKDIEKVALHIKNNFIPSGYALFFGISVAAELRISDQLRLNFHLFQEWVIFRFLSDLIVMARNSNPTHFLDQPISKLDLPEALKQNLAAFKTPSLRQFFESYSETDLRRSWVYENILEYHRLQKIHKNKTKIAVNPR